MIRGVGAFCCKKSCPLPSPAQHHVDRIFLVPFGAVSSSPSVNPEKLVGAQRLDVVCRCITSALMGSRHIRRDTTFTGAFVKPSWTTRVGQAILQSLDGSLPVEADPVGVLEVEGFNLQMLCPDEAWVASTLAQILSISYPATTIDRAGLHLRAKRTVGWRMYQESSLRSLLKCVLPLTSSDPNCFRLFVLREDAQIGLGEALRKCREEPVRKLVFVIGDHVGLRPAACGRLVTDFKAQEVSLGTTPLLTSHCISIIQFLVDQHWTARISRPFST